MSKNIIVDTGVGSDLRFTGTHYPLFKSGSAVTQPRLAADVTTALLLAAGTGSRLQPLTLDVPKCLTEVGGIPILKRLIDHLSKQGFIRLVVVIGHMGDRIQEFLHQHAGNMQVDYVTNPDYLTTNNIYSLWLARQQIRESFLLVESDLVFDTSMLDDMLQPNKIAISKQLPWMNGTTVELSVESGLKQRVTAFRMGSIDGEISDNSRQYKTVNLYSISLNSWHMIEQRLACYIAAGRQGEYYEAVFAEMVAEGTLCFDAVFFDANRWYEIDTLADLHKAENLFDGPFSSPVVH